MGKFKHEVASKLKAARKEQGITMRELGERLKVTQTTVARYESGNENLSSDLIERIAAAMDLSPEIKFKTKTIK